MLKKYTHISFDLDGTLVHTVPEYRHSVVSDTVAKLNGKIKESHSIDKFWFEAGRDKIIREEFFLDPDEFWAVFRKFDIPEERLAHTRAYEDAERTIRKLKEMGKIVSIITGAPHNIAEMEIGKLNGAPHDLYVSIHDNNFDVKPDPESFIFALKKLNSSPEETLYIGNSNEDAYYAKNAGADFVYLERKEHQFDLKDFSIATVHSLDELFEL